MLNVSPLQFACLKNPLVEVATISMNYFAIFSVIVLDDFCAAKEKLTHENTVSLLSDLGKQT